MAPWPTHREPGQSANAGGKLYKARESGFCVSCGYNLSDSEPAVECPECGVASVRRLLASGRVDRSDVRRFARVLLAVVHAGRAAMLAFLAGIVLAAAPGLPFSRGGHQGFLFRTGLHLPAVLCVFVAAWLATHRSVWSVADARHEVLRRRGRMWLAVFAVTYMAHAIAGLSDRDYAGIDTLLDAERVAWAFTPVQCLVLAMLLAHLGVVAIGCWLACGVVRSLAIAIESLAAAGQTAWMRRWLVAAGVALAVVLLGVMAQELFGPTTSRALIWNGAMLALFAIVFWMIALWRALGHVSRWSRRELSALDSSAPPRLIP